MRTPVLPITKYVIPCAANKSGITMRCHSTAAFMSMTAWPWIGETIMTELDISPWQQMWSRRTTISMSSATMSTLYACTCATCWTMMVSASSWAVVMSSSLISIPLLISTGTGSLSEVTSLWCMRSSLCDVRSLHMRSNSCDLFLVTVRMSFCEGRQVVFRRVYNRLAPCLYPSLLTPLCCPLCISMYNMSLQLRHHLNHGMSKVHFSCVSIVMRKVEYMHYANPCHCAQMVVICL